MSKTCSHGKPWESPCKECDAYWREHVSLPMLRRHAKAEGFRLVPIKPQPDLTVGGDGLPTTEEKS